MSYPDTNPYFLTAQNQDQHSQFPPQGPTTSHYGDQQNQQPGTSIRPSQHRPFPLNPALASGTSRPAAPRKTKSKRQDRRQGDQEVLGPWTKLPRGSQGPHDPASPPTAQPQPQSQHPPMAQSPPESQHAGEHMTEHKDGDQRFPSQYQRQTGPGTLVPPSKTTKPLIWFLAGFCAIFWVVIILGGLIVLIVYLVFRPHSPQFDVPGVTLNAAYLDVDAMLNADLTLLARFTNTNKKVKVDFSYVVLDLYYGETLIASQYIEPFSALRAESKLANVHMVTSQVRLPVGEVQRLRREISKDAVVFEVKGVFRARSNLGSFLRYSYWLYGHCTVLVTGPPSGVIKASKCKTKR